MRKESISRSLTSICIFSYDFSAKKQVIEPFAQQLQGVSSFPQSLFMSPPRHTQ